MTPEWGQVSQAEIDAAVAVETAARAAAVTAEATARDLAIAVHAALFGLHTKLVVKAADETINNSATLQNDDELFFAMAASEKWLVEVYLRTFCPGGSSTPKLKVYITTPSGAILEGLGLYMTPTATGVFLYNADREQEGVYADQSDKFLAYALTFIVTMSTTAGNFQVQWAQSTATAENTQVLAGSCLRAQKLA